MPSPPTPLNPQRLLSSGQPSLPSGAGPGPGLAINQRVNKKRKSRASCYSLSIPAVPDSALTCHVHQLIPRTPAPGGRCRHRFHWQRRTWQLREVSILLKVKCGWWSHRGAQLCLCNGSGAGTFPGKPECYEQAGQGLGVPKREKMPAKMSAWG